MRILLISGSYPPLKCGVGDYTQMLAHHLSQIPGNSVSILTSEASATTGKPRAETPEVATVSGWRLINVLGLYRQIRSMSPDVVHVQYPTQGYSDGWLPSLIPILAWMQGRVVVQTWHEGCSVRKVVDLVQKGVVPGGLVAVRPSYLSKIPKVLRWAVWNKIFRHIPNASSIPALKLDDVERTSLRLRHLGGQRRLIVYFGFILPHKGVELLFEIADPDRDHIVIAGESMDSKVIAALELLQREGRWKDRVTLAGFMESYDTAQLLACADAVVLPFRDGGGEWNSSIHAAVAQGTFVLSTSHTQMGYDLHRNLYLAKVDNVEEMRTALDAHAGSRRDTTSDIDQWSSIARQHQSLYERLAQD